MDLLHITPLRALHTAHLTVQARRMAPEAPHHLPATTLRDPGRRTTGRAAVGPRSVGRAATTHHSPVILDREAVIPSGQAGPAGEVEVPDVDGYVLQCSGWAKRSS